MHVCVTTSDRYHHLLPVFFYLYNKYWGEPFDLVGHAKPECELPGNCTWVSLGPQTTAKDWSTQLRPYFEQQPDWFVWMMEDTFIKAKVTLNTNWKPGFINLGRICLTNDITKRQHTLSNNGPIASQTSRYRLSTQPSIWNRDFLLQYLTPRLDPWSFETQDPVNDGWDVVGLTEPPVHHNEGVRRFDIHKLNLDGMCQEDVEHINKIVAVW